MELPKILIVDDDPNIRLVLERALRLDGYKLETAENGRAALDKINSTIYDLILLDLNMHPVSGTQVMNYVSQQGQGTVIIILTAHSTIESAVDALRQGAFDYLFKPATPESIRQRVRDGLQHRQQYLQRQRVLSQIEQLKETLAELEPKDKSLNSPERFLRSGKLVIDRHNLVASLEDHVLDLTTTEFNVLVSLVLAAPNPVSARQLVNQALNYDCEEAEARETIKWHIYHLRKKVEPNPLKPNYIKTVRYRGYLWTATYKVL